MTIKDLPEALQVSALVTLQYLIDQGVEITLPPGLVIPSSGEQPPTPTITSFIATLTNA